MQKAWKVVLILSITINLALGFILLSRPRSEEPDFSIYTERIDSLELELFTLRQIELELSTLRQTRDSVRSSIDTITIKISDNEKNYEEIRDIILSNSVNDDYVFFTEYLKQNRERLDSIDNP